MKYLFSAVKIGGLELKNRLVVPAMLSHFGAPDGKATERFIAYHEARAKGGWGLIITENYAVASDGRGAVNLPGLWDDGQIESHRGLVERVHRHGARICCQIYHAGRATHPRVANGSTAAPSPIRDFTRRDIPRALSAGEIQAIVKQFGDAAERAQKAGFDMLELHGAHGYLITQFLSPFSNKRTDGYGGSLNNRARFLMEIIREVRSRVGGGFPVQLRISAVEYVDGGGLELSDSQAIAQLAEAAGVDAIHVSQGHHAAMRQLIPPYAVPRAAFAQNAAAVKAAVSIPVIGVGRINDPLVAEALLASGAMDLVAMGRASLADPELPNKTAAGRLDELNYCFGCIQGCVGKNSKYGMRCFSNPALGHEFETPRKPAEQKKTVLVAGGGIAGCEAAVLAAEKGHNVSLWEAGSELGGQWMAAGMPPGKAEFMTLLFRQKLRLEKLNVAVHLNSPVTEAVLRQVNPDVLLIATGSVPLIPPIPGIEGAHVATAHDVLLGKVKTGKKAVVIGGGLAGAETADFAALQGAKVTILEMLPQIAQDGEPASNQILFESLGRQGVAIYTDAVCKAIGPDYVCFEKDGEEKRIESVDRVIVAAGMRADASLAETAGSLGIEAILIGDAAGVKSGLENIWEAFDTAATL